MCTILLKSEDEPEFEFRCEDVVESVPVNPKLPDDFDDRDNTRRPDRHLVWWGVPFVRTEVDNHPKFLAHWPSGTRYDVRCLDGGAWDRSTCWGQFGSLDEAVVQAKKGPIWQTAN